MRAGRGWASGIALVAVLLKTVKVPLNSGNEKPAMRTRSPSEMPCAVLVRIAVVPLRTTLQPVNCAGVST